MDTQPETTASSFVYNRIPTKVARKDFNRYIEPHLHRPKKGPKPKLSLYKIFNYILYVLHTGIQWEQLKTNRKELHYTNVYKWHNRWSKNGSYQKQVPRSLRRNVLPVELINRALLMGPEHVACALVELQQIGKTASGADGVLHDPPEAFDGVEVVPTMGR